MNSKILPGFIFLCAILPIFEKAHSKPIPDFCFSLIESDKLLYHGLALKPMSENNLNSKVEGFPKKENRILLLADGKEKEKEYSDQKQIFTGLNYTLSDPSSESTLKWKRIEIDPINLEPQTNYGSTNFMTVDDVDDLINKIPLLRSDYSELLRLSHAVPTAATIPTGQLQIAYGTVTPLGKQNSKSKGNQSSYINLDIGISDDLMLSAYFSKLKEQSISSSVNLEFLPTLSWKSFGVGARWRIIHNDNVDISINSSLEGLDINSGKDHTTNIFKNNQRHMFTKNIVGSLALPATWSVTDAWHFTLSPGITFLPTSQGNGNDDQNTFYGTNPYLSGGILWQPTQHLGIIGSIAQPIGSGANSLNEKLSFSSVPVFTLGLNLDLNPRISLRGQLTNGFGATPATALLTLPFENSFGYGTSIVFTPDGLDTPQQPLTNRQLSLSQGGITVNTALVPPDNDVGFMLGNDLNGNISGALHYSVSNILQLDLFSSSRSSNDNQKMPESLYFLKNGSSNWNIGGKLVALSPLRGSPFWGSGRLSIGRTKGNLNGSGRKYAFAEIMKTWEASPKIALNINPKLAIVGLDHHYGLGFSANIQVAPKWELIPEANLTLAKNNTSQSNATIGMRWSASPSLSIDIYGSTAGSLIDMGQFISTDQVRWGGRMLFRF